MGDVWHAFEALLDQRLCAVHNYSISNITWNGCLSSCVRAVILYPCRMGLIVPETKDGRVVGTHLLFLIVILSCYDYDCTVFSVTELVLLELPLRCGL